MRIRKSTLADLDRLMDIYNDARSYMRAHGNASQWGDGYPSPALIARDIEAGHSFVCEEEGEIVGVFCFFEGNDPTYEKIYEGAWLNDTPYGVIHRIAVAAHRRGVASFCYDYCFARCRNLKIDTHRDNIPMQNSLLKNGFQRCGIIYLANGDERIAYQKTGSK